MCVGRANAWENLHSCFTFSGQNASSLRVTLSTCLFVAVLVVCGFCLSVCCCSCCLWFLFVCLLLFLLFVVFVCLLLFLLFVVFVCLLLFLLFVVFVCLSVRCCFGLVVLFVCLFFSHFTFIPTCAFAFQNWYLEDQYYNYLCPKNKRVPKKPFFIVALSPCTDDKQCMIVVVHYNTDISRLQYTALKYSHSSQGLSGFRVCQTAPACYCGGSL